MYVRYNANPKTDRGIDCTVRAISTVLNKDWEDIYMELCLQGLIMGDMPTANHVWGKFLRSKGFRSSTVEDETVKSFADTHKKGRYILALKGHVVAVIDGDYYDTWDSGSEIPLYYWERQK